MPEHAFITRNDVTFKLPLPNPERLPNPAGACLQVQSRSSPEKTPNEVQCELHARHAAGGNDVELPLSNPGRLPNPTGACLQVQCVAWSPCAKP